MEYGLYGGYGEAPPFCGIVIPFGTLAAYNTLSSDAVVVLPGCFANLKIPMRHAAQFACSVDDLA